MIKKGGDIMKKTTKEKAKTVVWETTKFGGRAGTDLGRNISKGVKDIKSKFKDIETNQRLEDLESKPTLEQALHNELEQFKRLNKILDDKYDTSPPVSGELWNTYIQLKQSLLAEYKVGVIDIHTSFGTSPDQDLKEIKLLEKYIVYFNKDK